MEYQSNQPRPFTQYPQLQNKSATPWQKPLPEPTLCPVVVLEKKILLKISKPVIKKIQYLCSRLPKNEWSGILLYKVVGNFNTGNFYCRIVDIFPMNVGNLIYTEYEYDSEFISYRMENPNTLDCNLGHIHSHHNMETTFSHTDMKELHDNAPNHNYYLSLIVNNAFTPTAKIAFKGERTVTKKVVDNFLTSDNKLVKFKSDTKTKEEVLFIYNCAFDYQIKIDVEDSFKLRLDKLIKEYNLGLVKPSVAQTYAPITKPVQVEEEDEIDEETIEEFIIDILEDNFHSSTTIDEALNKAETKWKKSPDTYFNSLGTRFATALKFYYDKPDAKAVVDDVIS